MKQTHARSILRALNPLVFDWASGVMYNLLLAEPRVLFISAGNCFHSCWSHCFLRHEQTDWTESKQNYFFVSENWKCSGCFLGLCALPTLHPPMFMWSPHPYSVGFFRSSEACPLNRGGRRWWSAVGASSQEQNLWKHCNQEKKGFWDFSILIFLKCLCSEVWILILSKSSDTEVYILNNNCYANAISS